MKKVSSYKLHKKKILHYFVYDRLYRCSFREHLDSSFLRIHEVRCIYDVIVSIFGEKTPKHIEILISLYVEASLR